LFQSEERGSATSVGVNFLEDNTKSLTVNAYTGMYLKTDDDQFFEILSNTAIRYTLDAGGATPSLGSYAVIDLAADPLEPGVDYIFNESTGDLELVTALEEHDCLIAADDNASPGVGAYTYTEGLGATVQRAVNGDPADLETYPGLKATGTKILVLAPVVVSPTLQIRVVAAGGFSDADLEDAVQALVQTYVNSLGIGDNVILSEIIRLVKAIPGVADVVMVSPTSNVTVPQGQLARITDANVVVL
jgi:hypothetical protein